MSGFRSLLGYWFGGISSPLANNIPLAGSIDSRSSIGSELEMEVLTGGGQSLTSDLSGGVLVDRQLLAQLVASSTLTGNLTVTSVAFSYEIVDIALHLLTEKDLTLKIKKRLDISLER